MLDLSWRSKNEFVCNVLSWTLARGHTSVGRPEKTYIYQFCANPVYKTYQKYWLLGTDGKTELSESVMFAYFDDDDDITVIAKKT